MDLDAAVGPLAGLVLAAGSGERLAPLTWERPKALCPVGGQALLDLARDRLAPVCDAVAVNAHHFVEQIEDHLGIEPDAIAGGVHLSVEAPAALGTAGAIGRLRRWLDGRAVVVTNADAWCSAELADALADWDGRRVRVLVAGPPTFGPRSLLVATVLPAGVAASMPSTPAGLYEVCLRDVAASGDLEVVGTPAPFIDCGTPARYLAANLAVTGGANSVGADAVVAGRVTESVVWDGATVVKAEVLHRAIRTSGGRTVLVR
jgi:NDP-sugar pyrophosphorylase family protein